MSKRPSVSTVSSGYQSQQVISSNFENIQEHFDNFLSLSGDAPNAMLADLDMNHNGINNVGTIRASSIVVNGVQITASNALQAADAVEISITDTGGYFTDSNAEAALQELGSSLVSLSTTVSNNQTDTEADISALTGSLAAVTAGLVANDVVDIFLSADGSTSLPIPAGRWAIISLNMSDGIFTISGSPIEWSHHEGQAIFTPSSAPLLTGHVSEGNTAAFSGSSGEWAVLRLLREDN